MAKHQAARVDRPDIITLAVFGGLGKNEKLWPFSAATLRRRFSDLLQALGLPIRRVKGKRPFDLGSLRPGGATFMFLERADAECVRRRGRWVSSKVCDIYSQEVMYTTYTEKLTEDTKNASINLPLPFRASSTSPACSFEYQSHHARGIDSTRLKTLWSFERYGKRMGNLPAFAQRSSDGKLRHCRWKKWDGRAACLTTNKSRP